MRLAIPGILAQVERIQTEHRLELEAAPQGWTAVATVGAAAALLWLVVWLYGREGRGSASPRLRLLMAGLRGAVLAALLVVWMEPVLATYRHRVTDSYTLVLVDTSASMDLADRYRTAEDIARVRPVFGGAGQGPVRRIELVERILGADDGRFLRELAANNRVKICTFSDALQPLFTLRATREGSGPASPSPTGKGAAPLGEVSEAARLVGRLAAQGPGTDVGRALREAVDGLGRSPLAGVVLITDGGINLGDSAEVVARYAREHKVPLHIIGVGDPQRPRNVRVASVVAPENVFAEDPFAITAEVVTQGMAGDNVTVELVEQRADVEETGRVPATQTLTAGSDDAAQAVTFEHRQPAVGRWIYKVRVPVGETEAVADDNTRQAAVNVMENKLRVLVVAGAPNWEYRYVSRLLQRDRTFELSCWLQSADETAVRDGNVIIDHLPATAAELFQYDVIVLLDPDPLELGAEWGELAARFVGQQGGGLLFAAARLHTPTFMRYAGAAEVVKILPVSVDPDAELVLNDIGHYQQRPFDVVIPPDAAGHPILKLPGAAESGIDSWRGIGQVYWHYPVLRAKPVATVLMRHGNPRMQNSFGPHVLLATQYVGAGRTAFLGFDGTWRWRAVSETIFNKFWVQMIRYLVEGKLAGGNRRGLILTESDSFPLGAVVPISARLFDEAFQPLAAASITVRYRIGEDQGELTLPAARDRPGWFEGRFLPSRTGDCELSLSIPGGDPAGDVVRREIQIVRPDREILQPQMARATLIGLAEQADGGRYYDVSEAGQIPAAIPDRHESTTVRSRPIPLWDGAGALAVLVGLLAVEWAMRKVFHLL